ncbi:site-specific DNA-methyltransferase [archaeon]|nr:site-specific DNA-methyltransferase [archaeon]
MYFENTNEKIQILQDNFITTNLIPNSTVDLIVTSPPYNLDIHYNSHKDNLSYEGYLEFTKKWLRKAYEVTKDTGRLCLNIPLDKNKGGQQSVYSDILHIAKGVGWKYHSTIIWNEGNISRRTAWGSWKSASAPYVIAPVEVIVILYKNNWKRSQKGESTVTNNEFIEWTNGLWTFSGESKKKIGHPAPFPIELPKRCIKLFSYKNDVVLDPFLGSGTTLISCIQEGRQGIGVEFDKDYCDIAKTRLRPVIEEKSQTKLT